MPQPEVMLLPISQESLWVSFLLEQDYCQEHEIYGAKGDQTK